MLEWHPLGVHRLPLDGQLVHTVLARQHATLIVAAFEAGKMHCMRIHMLGTGGQILHGGGGKRILTNGTSATNENILLVRIARLLLASVTFV